MTDTETEGSWGLFHGLQPWERAAWDRGYEAEQHSITAELEISNFVHNILVGERAIQAVLGRPPLSRDYIAEWFGPEYVEPSDPA